MDEGDDVHERPKSIVFRVHESLLVNLRDDILHIVFNPCRWLCNNLDGFLQDSKRKFFGRSSGKPEFKIDICTLNFL